MHRAGTALTIMRYAFLLGAVAPVILSWIIARGHALSWPRGEMTAVVAVVALILTLFRGVIDKPGSPNEEIGLDYGWWLAIVGGLLILAGSVWRSQESAAAAKASRAFYERRARQRPGQIATWPSNWCG